MLVKNIIVKLIILFSSKFSAAYKSPTLYRISILLINLFIEKQQLLADVERLTSDKADLVTRYEEELRRANECKYNYKLNLQ